MIESNRIISDVIYLGQCTYPESFAIQEECLQKVLNFGSTKILGCEYDRVLTLGKRVPMEQLQNDFRLKQFSIHSTDRGGLITLHNRGQLVIYPLLSLREMALGVRDYLRVLCRTTEFFLRQHYGIESHWKFDHPDGLFVGNQKIAFIGIRVDRGISKHGISLNICNDTSEFGLFTACGQEGLSVTNIQTLCPQTAMGDLKLIFHRWCEEFHRQLQGNMKFQCNQSEVLLDQGH